MNNIIKKNLEKKSVNINITRIISFLTLQFSFINVNNLVYFLNDLYHYLINKNIIIDENLNERIIILASLNEIIIQIR